MSLFFKFLLIFRDRIVAQKINRRLAVIDAVTPVPTTAVIKFSQGGKTFTNVNEDGRKITLYAGLDVD